MLRNRPLRSGASGLSGLALAALLLSTFVGYLDTFIVNVAGPTIHRQLGATFTQVELTISGYTAAYATGLVLGGRLGDVYGHRRVWMYGTAAFTAASVLCAAAPNPELLIVARVLQGFAAAAVLPQILAIIRSVGGVGPAQRRALAWYGATAGLAAVSGQLIGGALLGSDLLGLGWRTIFLVNIPTGVGALLIGGRVLPRTGERVSLGLDMRGALLLVLAVGLGLYPLVAQSDDGWSLTLIGLVLAGVALAHAFVRHELRVEAVDPEAPILRLSLLRLVTLRWGLIVVFAYFGGNAGLFLALAYYLQSGLGLSALGSAATFLPLGVGFVISSSLTAPALRRWTTGVLVMGAVLVTASLPILLLATRLAHPRGALGFGLFVNGVGEGLLDVPLFGFVLSRVPAEIAGAASGLVLTCTQVAAVLSVALTGAIFAGFLHARRGALLAPGRMELTRYTTAFDAAIVWLLILSTFTLSAVVVTHRRAAAAAAATRAAAV